MTTTQTPTHPFVITEPWYFYASPTYEYICHFGPDDKIPALFHGPYHHQYEATQAYREWKLEQMEHDGDESD